MRFWKQSRDRELEAQLRAERPEADAAFTRALADRVRPRGSVLGLGIRRLPLGLAGGLTAIMLTAVIALGGAHYPVDVASKALNFKTAQQSQLAAPTVDQYGTRVTVCVRFGQFAIELRLQRRGADVLVRIGLATVGPCRS